MSGKAPKRKGDGYERELAKYFNEKVLMVEIQFKGLHYQVEELLDLQVVVT